MPEGSYYNHGNMIMIKGHLPVADRIIALVTENADAVMLARLLNLGVQADAMPKPFELADEGLRMQLGQVRDYLTQLHAWDSSLVTGALKPPKLPWGKQHPLGDGEIERAGE